MRPTPGSGLAAWGYVIGNLVPLAGVLAFDWSVAVLLLVYWLESAVASASFFWKIRRARGTDEAGDLPALTFNDRSVQSFVDSRTGESPDSFSCTSGSS